MIGGYERLEIKINQVRFPPDNLIMSKMVVYCVDENSQFLGPPVEKFMKFGIDGLRSKLH